MIKFRYLKAKSTEFKSELDSVHGRALLSFSLVRTSTAEFKRDRMSIFVEERPGGPKIERTN